MKSSKTALARSLGISRGALYYKPLRPQKDALLRDIILKVLDEHPAYGHRRIAIDLSMNKKRILRVMNLYRIRPKIVRRKKYAKYSEEVLVETPNHLRHICTIRPNSAWVGDFTEMWFHGRKIYLATVMDHFTREIIGWQLGLHHTATLVIDVLKEALRKRNTAPQYFHSDQGSEYTSHACVGWLVRHSIQPSNSPKGKPWHNGRQESFYSNFKLEFGRPQAHNTIEGLIEALGKYVHYYNTKRIHSALKMPPRRFFEKKKLEI